MTAFVGRSNWDEPSMDEQQNFKTNEYNQNSKNRDQFKQRKAAFFNCCPPCSMPILTGILIGALVAGIALATILTIYLRDSTRTTSSLTTTITSTVSISSTFTSSTSSSTITIFSSTASISTTSVTKTTTTSATTFSTTSVTTTTTTTTTTTKPYCTTLITFDDISNQSSTFGVVSNGYNNLNWTNTLYVNASTMPVSGYQYVVTSPPYVAYNPAGATVKIASATGTSFSFDSMIVASAWRDNLTWSIYGYRSGINMIAGSLSITVINRTIVTCDDCTNLDTLYFTGSGGTPYPGLTGNGTEFTFDNLCISFGY